MLVLENEIQNLIGTFQVFFFITAYNQVYLIGFCIQRFGKVRICDIQGIYASVVAKLIYRGGILYTVVFGLFQGVSGCGCLRALCLYQIFLVVAQL